MRNVLTWLTFILAVIAFNTKPLKCFVSLKPACNIPVSLEAAALLVALTHKLMGLS
jgi:hypothetical protein